MSSVPRPLAFVLAATDQGMLIVNRFDRHMTAPGEGYGVGFQLLERGAYDPDEIELALSLLRLRRESAGDGVVALDGGANVGVHAVCWARAMTGWGRVVAVEAQERVFYALAGNAALGNCFNLRAVHAALAARDGVLRIPMPDYTRAGSFGSLGLLAAGAEFIGQPVSYEPADLVPVRTLAIDSMNLDRLDLLKLDVEGMEAEALAGARETLNRHRPLVLVEHVKAGEAALRAVFEEHGYAVHMSGINLLAVHPSDPCAGRITVEQAS